MAQKKDPELLSVIEYKGTYQYSVAQFEKVRDFKCREDDIWVCSFPRSGTTLTQHTVYLIQTLDFEKASTVPLEDRFPWIELEIPSMAIFRGPKYLDEKPESEPRMIKSHFHYFLLPEELKQGKGKIIYIARNPKSAIPSLYRFLRFMKQTAAETLRDFIELYLTGKDLYACPWGLHVRQYWEHAKDENVLFLTFEDTVKDRPGTIRRIAKFLGKELTDADVEKIVECTTIEAMKNNKAVNLNHVNENYNTGEGVGQFINKGDVAGWKNDVPEDLIQQMDEMIERELGHTDLKFM